MLVELWVVTRVSVCVEGYVAKNSGGHPSRWQRRLVLTLRAFPQIEGTTEPHKATIMFY